MAGFRGLFVRAGTVGTQASEARKALAGLLVPSSVLGARQGILPAPGNPLKVSGTAGWEYSVNAGHVTTSRSDADGPTLFGSDGTTLTSAVSAAPASGSRYDLIYLRHLDPDQGEGDPAVVIGVVEGVASGSPVKPSVPAGAVVIAESLMAAGATSTNHANVTITQVLSKTVARGGILPVANQAERDALAKWAGLVVWRIDTSAIEVCDGTAWGGPLGDTGWVNVSIASGFAAQDASNVPQVRRIGKVVYMTGGWSSTGMVASTTPTIGTIPSGFRPSTTQAWGAGSSNALATATAFVQANGDVQIRLTGTLSSYYRYNTSWPI